MSKRSAIFSSFLFLVIFLLISPKAAADYRQEVLATSTGLSMLQVPPTVQGPGFILPDSPFFFFDQLKQNVRLFFAFTPEAKAKVNANVAGERLAELRFMLARNNLSAAKIALEGISDNFNKAVNEVAVAKLAGRNVSALAKSINDDIKQKRQTLDVLNEQTKGELKARVDAVQTSLFRSKVEVEDALSENELENEIRDDLNKKAQERIKEASDSAREIQADLSELQKEASGAAQSSLTRRQEALQKAIEKKNEVLRKVEEKLLEKEKKKQEKLLEAQGKASEEAKEAIQKAQEAAIKFQKFADTVNEIRNKSASIELKPTTASNKEEKKEIKP